MFHNATGDLNLKCCEELDLLTKWLSGESLQHALRIRAVHVSNPEADLERLWQRLDRNFGSPEAVEASLFGRLESFPKVGHKDSRLLQELADLLQELQVAKDKGYLPGLSFLDTSRGINPIVEKLPGGLQEAWVKEGSRDPSFILQNCGPAHMKAERTLERQTRFKVPVTKNKTQVSAANNEPKAPPHNPNKQCPLHKKPHSLAKCRGFRMKTLDERRSLLKELSICYKCLLSTEHRAKTCKAGNRCVECNSDSHTSAMHACPPPWTDSGPDTLPLAHGGEPDTPSPTVTTSSCTEVCGQGLQGKSCSKICLVNLYPCSAPNEKRKMYAILDDQSNVSLAGSPFFDMFNLHGEALPYTMKHDQEQ